MSKRRVTPARRAQVQHAARTHGLYAIATHGGEALPSDAPEVRALLTVGDVAAECGGLRDGALEIASELGRKWPGERQGLALAEAGDLLSFYAELSGRCAAAMVEIESGAVRAIGGALSPEAYAEAMKHSAGVCVLLLQLVKVGRQWLQGNGVYEPDSPSKPRPILRRFGGFIERGKRQLLRHAALLAMGAESDEWSAGKVLEAMRRE